MENYTFSEEEQKQLDRLKMAGVGMTMREAYDYVHAPDDLGEYQEGKEVPNGYKKCGGCKHVLKLYLFNVNNSTKNKCTGNCKTCQKTAAAASYERTKSKRNYKAYYAEHKDIKQQHGKEYYEKHKEEVLAKQRLYHGTKQGQKVMKKSHTKRRKLINKNKGIPYKREYVIERDKMGGKLPICYICGKPIEKENDLQLDHVIGINIGGKDSFDNVACTHKVCNLKKSKDCREVSVGQVETIIARSEDYIDKHPDLFAD